MTVAELIERLKTHDQEREVCVTWEGVFRSIGDKEIYAVGDRYLFLDGDECHYKQHFIDYPPGRASGNDL